MGVALHHEERDRVGRPEAELDHPLQLGVHRAERVAALDAADAGGHELEDAVARLRHRAEQGRDLDLGRERPGYRPAAEIAVTACPAGRHPERAGVHGLDDDRVHGLELAGVGVFVGAPAHHVRAHRRVRNVRTDVDRARCPVEGVEVLGKRLPVPRDPLGERAAGDVLDAFHELDEPLVPVGARRREADAAVPEDGRGHAVPARRCQVRVPGRLPVEVGVHVDEPRRDQQPVGVDDASRAIVGASHVDDHAALDRYVGRRCGRAGAVDDGATPDQQVVHRPTPRLARLIPRPARRPARRPLRS